MFSFFPHMAKMSNLLQFVHNKEWHTDCTYDKTLFRTLSRVFVRKIHAGQ